MSKSEEKDIRRGKPCKIDEIGEVKVMQESFTFQVLSGSPQFPIFSSSK